MSGKEFKDHAAAFNWFSELNVNQSGWISEDTVKKADPRRTKSYSPCLNNDIVETDVGGLMNSLFQKQLYTDVEFISKDGIDSVSAHRAVLAAKCGTFAELLYGNNVNEAKAMKMTLTMSNLSFSAFKKIIEYLYTDDVSFENDAFAEAVLDGAKQFKIYSLAQRCNSYFESQELTEQNVCSKLQMSKSKKNQILKNRCIEYIQKNTLKVINSPDFQSCNSTTIRTICKLQSLNLRTEVDLLNACMRWLNNQNASDKKRLIEELTKCFRFLTFTVSEFGDVMRRYPNLVTAEDGLKIMLYLYNPPKTPDFKSLPSWINKNYVKRCVITEIPCENPPTWEDSSVGRVIIPLRYTDDSSIAQKLTELTSLLQLRCIQGFHQIKAIKLAFKGPVFEKSAIKMIIIKVHVSPRNFEHYEHIEIRNSLEVTVTFSRMIKARRGDLIDIEVEAKNIKLYKFLEFDQTCQVPANQHFQCCVSNLQKCGKLYFIKEVEYSAI